MPDRMYEAYGDRAQREGIGDWQMESVDLGRPGLETRPAGRMSFTGLGPKSYRRPDTTIEDDVCGRLSDDGELDATGIMVRVADGEVTLEGEVDSRFAKRHAEILTEAVRGVRDVHNRLRIVPRHVSDQQPRLSN